MESINEVRTQVYGLLKGIRECNFIPWEDKQDLAGDILLKLLEKFQEGVIVDNSTQIKGYVFQVTRNFCLAYHRVNNKKVTCQLKWEVPEETSNREEYIEELKSLIFKKMYGVSYDDKTRGFIKLAFDGLSYEDILSELEITSEEGRRIKQKLVKRMKFDLKRETKYLIRNDEFPHLEISCVSREDLKKFFPLCTPRRITYMIETEMLDERGFYIVMDPKYKEKVKNKKK